MIRSDRRAQRAGSRTALAICALVLGLVALILPGVSPSVAADPSATGPGPTSVTPIDVVGDPVAGEGAADAVTVDASHNLHLVGVAPDTGRVIWTKPFSESAIDTNLPPGLDPIGNLVIDLVPAVKISNPLVNVEALNMTTGAVVWSGPQDVLVAEPPSPCVHMTDFCVTVYNKDGSSTTAFLSPTDGNVVGLLKGAGTVLDYDLYQTGAKTPRSRLFRGRAPSSGPGRPIRSSAVPATTPTWDLHVLRDDRGGDGPTAERRPL